MSTAGDIKAAKAVFGNHCTAHKCKAGQCDLRRALWLQYMRMAELWGP